MSCQNQSAIHWQLMSQSTWKLLSDGTSASNQKQNHTRRLTLGELQFHEGIATCEDSSILILLIPVELFP